MLLPSVVVAGHFFWLPYQSRDLLLASPVSPSVVVAFGALLFLPVSCMFALNPGGSGSGEKGGPGSTGSNPTRDSLWFFGKLGLYFVALRAAYVVLSARDRQRSLPTGP